jgi:hypothetical protein
MRWNHIESYCRATYGLPDDWQVFALDMGEEFGPRFEVKGCVPAGVYKRGPRKGRTKFAGGTLRTTLYPGHAECAAWIEDHCRARNVCVECDGSKRTLWKSSAAGIEWRTCRECGGTGEYQSP